MYKLSKLWRTHTRKGYPKSNKTGYYHTIMECHVMHHCTWDGNGNGGGGGMMGWTTDSVHPGRLTCMPSSFPSFPMN